MKRRVVNGDVVAVDGTAVKAYSQRSLDNKTGKSDLEARVGRARRGFILGYKVHAARCTGPDGRRDRGTGRLLRHSGAGGRGVTALKSLHKS